jgi:hypothetical protein
MEPAVPPEYLPEPHWKLYRKGQELFWNGEVACEIPLEEATRGLLQGGRDWWFHPRRLRRLKSEGQALLLGMDEGTEVKVNANWATSVLQGLGVISDSLLPAAFTRIFLRDYPFDIVRAPMALLRQHFQTEASLIANLVWQQLLDHRLGIDKGYGNSIRGFWYTPIQATVERWLGQESDTAEQLYYRIVSRMVGDDRIFCYRDLGFVHENPHLREIGSRHPGVVLVIEKSEVAEGAKAAARHFGISWIVTGGVSRLFAAEFFSYSLREVHAGDARALIFGDFDPGGRVNGKTFVAHLSRFDVNCPAGPEFLIDPSVFTEEELELFSRPLSQDNNRVDEWLVETGGIHGQARGIHCDWLQPPERLLPLIGARLEA